MPTMSTNSAEFIAEVLGPISWPSLERSPEDWRDRIGHRVRSNWRYLNDATKLAIAMDAHDMIKKSLEQEGSFY